MGEEVEAALARLVKVLGDLQQQRPGQVWRINALYHDDESAEPRLRQLLPLAAADREYRPTRMRLCSIWNRRNFCPSLPTSIFTPRCMKYFTFR